MASIEALHGMADAFPKTHWPMKKVVAMVVGSGALLLGHAAVGNECRNRGKNRESRRRANPGRVPSRCKIRRALQSVRARATGRVKYAIHGLAPGTYTMMLKGQTAVAYVGDQGITVDWGIAANSQVIAAARQGTAPPSASVGGKSSMKDLAAKQVGPGNSDRNENAVQRGDCAEDEDDGEQSNDAEMVTNVEPGAEGPGRRHCQHTESN